MRASARPLLLGLVAAAAPAAACLRAGTFACVDDEACREAGQRGACEPSGWCSFADDRCDSGARYSRFAGDGLAGACTERTIAEGTSTSTGLASSSSESGSASSSSSDGGPAPDLGPPPVREPKPIACGNGYLESGESCDDGNLVDADGCNGDCVPSGTVRWTTLQQGDAGGNDYGYGLSRMPDGDVIAAGRSAGDSGDAWFSRYDFDTGAQLRTWLYSTEQTEEGRGIVASDDGRIYGVGWIERPADTNRGEDPLTAGYFDHAIRGREPGGPVELLWSNGPDSPNHGDDRGWAIALRADHSELVIFGKGGSPSDTDSHVRGYGLDGVAPRWSSLVGIATVADEARAGFIADDDRIFAAGVVNEPSGNKTDAWIGELAVGPVGQPGTPSWAWTTRLGDAGRNEVGHALAPDGDDGLVLAGHAGFRAMWARYDRDGHELARLVDDGDVASEFHGIAVDGSGAVIAVGYVTSTLHLQDAWVVKWSADGTPLWSDRYDGDAHGDDRARAVIVTEQDEIVVLGYAATVLGGSDLWLRRYAP
ncbi:MAG: hypothetical protein K1X88_24680 [Nannocystaceae bacterium]|nr:hypothetical protein [Nannocystaceae bacterium]